MTNCIKRQREESDQGTQHRCLNKRADPYLQIVDDRVCESCPVKVLLSRSLPVFNGPPCEFRQGSSCGVTGLPVDKDICTRCVKEAKDEMATLGDKISNYASAVRRWVAAGRPVRSDKQVAEIYENHCSGCQMFDAEKQACKSCGCAVSKGSFPLTNKLKMATESCPLGRFE